MKTIIKFAFAFTLIIGISIFLTRCKSHQEPESTTSTQIIDADLLPADTIVTDEEIADDAKTVEPVTANTKTMKDTSQRAKPVVKTIATQKPLTLIINNLKSESAPVIVSVYGTESKFPDPHGQLKEYKFKPHSNVLTAKIANLKFGTYAIATYQDENSSGEIDKNFIGMPTEGYAFSQNFKPTIKAPNFDQCKFDYNANENTLTIKMIR
jgi:uncharacterized protein (DUF2141 family)